MRQAQQAPKMMGWLDHIAELRRRLIWTAATFLVGAVVAFCYSPAIVGFLTAPAKSTLVFTRPGEAFAVHFQVAMVTSLVANVPVALYHLLAFVFPGLTPSERKVVLLALGPALVLFASGVTFSYLVVVPLVYRFFMGYAGPTLQPMVSVGAYVSFVAGVVVPFGLVFELPVVVGVLSALGLVHPRLLRRARKYAILTIAVLGALMSPGTDPFSQLLMALPLVFLYELSIGFSAMVWAAKRRAAARRSAAETATGAAEQPG